MQAIAVNRVCPVFSVLIGTGGLQMITVRLPGDVMKRLDALASATGRTRTFYARAAILAHLEDLEDTYLAEKRLADYRAGKTGAVPIQDLMNRYGMES